MNILVVGFGGMGCRHAQSVLNAKIVESVFVVEPSDEIFTTNLSRIGATINQVVRFKSIEEINQSIEIAIVATSSAPRFEIVKKLISKGIKIFLLEKILFQSISQFNEVIDLLNANGCKTFCNLPNRYFVVYNKIKELYVKAGKPKLKMNLIAGDFGLTCNSIHYIDLFSYFTGALPKVNFSNLSVSEKPNRRGDIYKELTGEFSLIDSMGNQLNIIANPTFEGGPVIQISYDDCDFVLYESTQSAFMFSKAKMETMEFEIIPSSRLTSVIVEDILKDSCRLPSVEELYPIHLEFFKSFNPCFNLDQSNTTICPIT